MHGLINRAVRCFVRDTYGLKLWPQVSRAADFGGDGFNTMAMYDLSVTNALVDAAAQMPGTGMRSIVMIVKRLSDAC
jgi:Haem-NO-binding